MKKILPILVVSFLVVAVGVAISRGYIDFLLNPQDKNNGNNSVDSLFDYEGSLYVEDAEIGRYPGVAEHNVGSSEFSSYTQNQDQRAKLREKYVLYAVREILNTSEGRILLFVSGETTEHVFKCSSDRTAAFTLINQKFISSGFDFMSTVTPGDRVYTKCMSDDCIELGPDCIILKGTTN